VTLAASRRSRRRGTGVLVHHRHRAVAVAREEIARAGIAPSASTPIPIGRVVISLPGLIVGDREHTAATATEQPVMPAVDGHRHRLRTGRRGPASRHCGRPRVDLHHFAGVRQVRVDLAAARLVKGAVGTSDCLNSATLRLGAVPRNLQGNEIARLIGWAPSSSHLPRCNSERAMVFANRGGAP
jgi:hypothetical protein